MDNPIKPANVSHFGHAPWNYPCVDCGHPQTNFEEVAQLRVNGGSSFHSIIAAFGCGIVASGPCVAAGCTCQQYRTGFEGKTLEQAKAILEAEPPRPTESSFFLLTSKEPKCPCCEVEAKKRRHFTLNGDWYTTPEWHSADDCIKVLRGRIVELEEMLKKIVSVMQAAGEVAGMNND